VIRCPECSAEIDVDEDEVEEGEILSCPECESELEVSQTHPVHLNLIADDSDEEDDEEDEGKTGENGDLIDDDDDEEEEEAGPRGRWVEKGGCYPGPREHQPSTFARQ